jgi:hypothetical protein
MWLRRNVVETQWIHKLVFAFIIFDIWVFTLYGTVLASDEPFLDALILFLFFVCDRRPSLPFLFTLH